MFSAPSAEAHANGGEDDVDREQGNDAEDKGFVDRCAHPFGSARHSQSAIAADETGDESERGGLDDRDDDFGQAREERERRDVGPCGDVLYEDSEDEAADEADGNDGAVE